MEYDDERQAFTFIAGIALGTLIGAGVALLMAPQSGERTRKRIARAAEDLGDSTRERFEEASDDVRRRANRAVRAAERHSERLRDGVRRKARHVEE
jgi:gas vesicle protein